MAVAASTRRWWVRLRSTVPPWHEHLRASRKSLDAMLAVQRVLALRLARGYRTVALEVALALAGQLPWDKQAGVRARMYTWRADLRARGIQPAPLAMRSANEQLRRRAIEEWSAELTECRRGLRADGAIRPVLKEWMDRCHGGLTYRLAQVLTGHGCFGEYLCQKARRETDNQMSPL